MNRTTEPKSETASPQVEAEAEEEFVWPEFNPSTGYRHFIERLRLARIERGLSIADMSELVGLHLKSAYEFENLVAPLPFCHLEIWCDAVGVPFENLFAIYFADEREWGERLNQRLSEQNAPCITNTNADEANRLASETPAPASAKRRFGFLLTLRAAFARIARYFRSLFSTP